ncbi:MAG: peptidase S8 [Gottschalkiaceae bacterium]|nr:MAG: peptidase S8 [Gottschalkiaceae bacterium]
MKKLLCVVLTLALVIGAISSVGARANADEADYYYSVVFKSNEIPGDFNEEIANYGAKAIYSVPEVGFVQIQGKVDFLSKIKDMKGIQAANPSLQWTMPEGKRIDAREEMVEAAGNEINNSYTERYWWDRQWDIKRITENGNSYEFGTGSHDVAVAIIDTGIDRDHPDLVNNILPGSKNFVPSGGFRGTEPGETGNPNAFDDKHGHGSHVAGSIAANGYMVGVAPNTGIRAYRVFGTSSAESAWIINAMIAAADDGADILSMSLGGFDVIGQVFYIDPETGKRENLGNDVADFIAYKRAVKYATKKGTLVVVAAGNDAINCTNKREVTDFLNSEYGGDGIIFVGAGFNVPAIYPEVVTVSATGPEDVLANYSNYGPGFIDIGAVGGDARLYDQYLEEGRFDEYLANKLYYNEFCLSASEDGNYYYSIGTSMSTPKVSAVAALIIDKYGKMSPAKIKDMLVKKAIDSVKGNDKKFFGAGHLNAYKALQE